MVIPATLPGRARMSVEPAEGKAETGLERDRVQKASPFVYWTQPRLTWLLKF